MEGNRTALQRPVCFLKLDVSIAVNYLFLHYSPLGSRAKPSTAQRSWGFYTMETSSKLAKPSWCLASSSFKCKQLVDCGMAIDWRMSSFMMSPAHCPACPKEAAYI
eukprot:2185142-Amphidinium_carterae.1